MKKEKIKFICVSPVSSNAKNYFYIDMDNLHSCRVKGEKDGKMYLESLNKKHYFWVDKKNDSNWRIEK
jgi:sensor histidine kinase YesM